MYENSRMMYTIELGLPDGSILSLENPLRGGSSDVLISWIFTDMGIYYKYDLANLGRLLLYRFSIFFRS